MPDRPPGAPHPRALPPRTLLVAGVLAANLLAAVLALANLYYAREQADQRVLVTTQNLAKSMELTFNGLIDTIDVALLASADEISRQLASGTPDTATINAYLLRQTARLPGVVLRASDEHGKVVFVPGDMALPIDITDRAYFTRLRDDPQAGLMVDRPLVGRIIQQWLWLFARRIHKPDGSFGGVVFARIELSQIERILAQIQLYPDSTLALRDAQWGLIAGRLNGAERYPIAVGDRTMSADFQQAFKADSRGGSYNSSSTKLDSVLRHFSFAKSDKYGFIVTAGMSDRMAYAEWRKHAWISGALLAAFALLSWVFARLLSRAWRAQQRDVAALRAAQDIASLGSFDIDLRTLRYRASETTLRIFGVGPGFAGDTQGILDLIVQEFRDEIQAGGSTAYEQRLPFDREYSIVRLNDGETRWVHSRGRLRLDAKGRPVAVSGTIQDITERKTAELEVVQLNEYLEQRVAERTTELEAAVQRLRESQEELAQSQARATLSTLAAGVSHELNSPIGNSVMVATTLKDQARTLQRQFGEGRLKRSEFTEFLTALADGTELVERNLLRAEHLLKNFRQVAADQASEQRRVFDLLACVREVVQTLSPSLQRHAHQLVLDIPEGIRMDSLPGPLGQVVVNLVNNAYQHAFEGRRDGVLTIAAQVEGEQVLLSFSDNGAGIAPDHLALLFQPFFSTKIGRGGTGLGMAIVKNLVTKSLGGSIEVQSVIHQGTRVLVRLPLVLPQAPAETG